MVKENDLLQMLGELHNFWVGTVYSFGGTGEYAIPKQVAESIVSDMYLKLDKYVKTPERILHSDGTLNKTFVYVTLRNLFFGYKSKETKYNQKTTRNIEMLNNWQSDNYDTLLDVNKQLLNENILTEIETWHYYDTKVFKLIFYEGISMRQLSRETGISLSSIFNTVKACKLKLKTKFQNEYNNTNN